jgi:HK97 family phage major capsid protein
MESKKLLEERAVVASEMNGLTATLNRDGKTAFSADDLEKFDKLDNEFKSLSDRIETLKRVERSQELTQARQNISAPAQVTSHRAVQVSRNDQEMAFKCWALKQAGKEGNITRAHTDAAHKVGMNLNSDQFVINLSDRPNEEVTRNQSSSLNSEGGYLTNDGIFQGLERNMKWFGGARSVAKVIRTDTGEPLSWSFADDTSNLGGQVGQNPVGGVANTNVIYQKKTLGEYTFASSVYPVSVQILQDARISITDDISEVLGMRLGRITNSAYTNGLGNATPTGFMTDASAGVTAGGAAIAYTDLVGLLFSIDRAYRDDPSFAFTMSDSTLLALWKILDTTGRPLFYNYNQSMINGNPLQILNKPIVVNNDMPSIATGKSPICAITGNKFIIRDVKEATVVALRELYMQQLAVGFIAYLRTDSKLLNPNTAKKLTMP